MTATESGQDLVWSEPIDGYTLALDGKKLRCRNAKGKLLQSVPKQVRETEQADLLLQLRDYLERHEREVTGTIDTWMLRSLPLPLDVLVAVWPDPTWQTNLTDLVVVTPDGTEGLLRGADADRGVGVVTLDGETEWLRPDTLTIPHPMLISELEDFRDFASELRAHQSIDQLYRATYERPATLSDGATTVTDFQNGKFEQLIHALGRCRSLGYAVRGGFAVTRVWEAGRQVEAQFWVGADAPEGETWTGDLSWADREGRTQPIAALGPVAYSEGVRMAAAIFSARAIDESADQ